MLVKICGIKTKQAADVAVRSGADFIGFVFAESTRTIIPESAASIVKSLPTHINKVGVFVNESIDRIIKVAELVGLDYIQLHGDEDAAVAERLPYKIIKAFSVEPENFLKLQSYPCDYVLLDSPKGKYRGGNGTAFDWKSVDSLSLNHDKIILAGGLSPENVKLAIHTVRPAGVDVSSGVETDNKKDHDKIRSFIQEAKHTRKDDFIDNLYNAR
ncbi:phosphoribosylanthranilate isomerase [Oceanobacillus bengalensis]|uniref:phosphoribosylanthranilate isomerase n=1 Tax=Oceanobacillus bengalensis TaxID=1435466 RepID=UPI001FECF4CE|nr:phosphoribosylanthranilate isomerase [Oceanobacillus bengalensis]